jgi:hypothetical protein
MGRFGPIIIVDEIRVCCTVLRVYMSKCWAKSTKFPNKDIREDTEWYLIGWTVCKQGHRLGGQGDRDTMEKTKDVF